MAHASDLSPEFVLLGLLAQGPSYGYELHQRLSSDFEGIWHMSQSQCYNILHRLEEKGALQGKMVQLDHPPHRRLFKITPSGQQDLNTWLTNPTPSSTRAIRIAFLTRLHFARLEADDFAGRIIAEQQDSIQHSLMDLKKNLDQIPLAKDLNRLSLQLRIRQLEICVEWLDECEAIIDSINQFNGGVST